MLSEISGGRFDAVTILLGHLTAGGLGGGWLGALQPETLETFAPWHALFYCGFVVTAGWSWPPPPGPANQSGLGSPIRGSRGVCQKMLSENWT
jgi:hypothetical protein